MKLISSWAAAPQVFNSKHFLSLAAFMKQDIQLHIITWLTYFPIMAPKSRTLGVLYFFKQYTLSDQ